MANEDAIYIGELAMPMIKGEKGDKGDQGPQGEPGIQGVAGQSATIAVGAVQTGDAGTPAIVTNSGTASNAVLNFTIPKGDKGDKGDRTEYDVATEATNGLMSAEDKAFINQLENDEAAASDTIELLNEINGEDINTDTIIDIINGEEITE
jgi:hypothetical protein